MIDKGEGDREQKQRNRDNLRDVIKYCENQIDCRRKLILLYFNENLILRIVMPRVTIARLPGSLSPWIGLSMASRR